MGEGAKQEEAKTEVKAEENVVILSMDLHCAGCAKKIERWLLRCRGVDEVESDMVKNQVKIRGVVDPQDLRSRLQTKTKRSVEVIFPKLLPPPDQADSTEPQLVASEEAKGVTTVELQANLHCEACAEQLRRKILKLRGVLATEIDVSNGKITVTGTRTLTGDKLVDYIYRKTRKVATVIPPPPPPPPLKEEKIPEEKFTAEKKEEKPAEEEEKKLPPEPVKEEKEKEEAKKGGDMMQASIHYSGPDEIAKRVMYWNGGYMGAEEEMARRMGINWMPVYMIQQPLLPQPSQLFSDENPNACCIS